jgi:hypothetical protein
LIQVRFLAGLQNRVQREGLVLKEFSREDA